MRSCAAGAQADDQQALLWWWQADLVEGTTGRPEHIVVRLCHVVAGECGTIGRQVVSVAEAG